MCHMRRAGFNCALDTRPRRSKSSSGTVARHSYDTIAPLYVLAFDSCNACTCGTMNAKGQRHTRVAKSSIMLLFLMRVAGPLQGMNGHVQRLNAAPAATVIFQILCRCGQNNLCCDRSRVLAVPHSCSLHSTWLPSRLTIATYT